MSPELECLDSVVECFDAGLSPETILGEFDTLNLAQVYGAITYYLENQASINAYRVRQEQRFEAARRGVDPLTEDLRNRLNAARFGRVIQTSVVRQKS